MSAAARQGTRPQGAALLTGAASLVGAVGATWAFAPVGAGRLLALAGRAFDVGAASEPAAIGHEAMVAFAYCVGPAFLGGMAGALVAGLVQARGGMASRRSISDGAKAGRRDRARGSIGMFVVAIAALGFSLRRESTALDALWRISGASPILDGASIVGRIGLRVGVALLVAGAAEFAWRWWRERQGERPSRGEARREAREDRADPRLRAEVRRRQQSETTAPPTRNAD